MGKKSEFHTVEFFRKIRDEQAAALAGKSVQEVIAYFATARKTAPKPSRARTTRRDVAHSS